MTETIVCDCCGNYATVDARDQVVHYAHGDDPAARRIRHELVTTARRR
ncbi:hypothetical protein [Planomonospora parontospora]|nr:hypothetical protein [Planomonospora parontospora]GGL56643.1 hypothetical protein GCM10014719_67560 [Planomonospora parontospora subsp. antibiotica]GII19946.1 hypothetical protein Ppa05_66720 [Planomonospora parontospora subsp. antibiotica]